jgi:hypothetical protein
MSSDDAWRRFDFVVPRHDAAALTTPRRAVQLVDAPLGSPAFVYDPSGQVQPYLSTVVKPVKVVAVAGTYRYATCTLAYYRQL